MPILEVREDERICCGLGTSQSRLSMSSLSFSFILLHALCFLKYIPPQEIRAFTHPITIMVSSNNKYARINYLVLSLIYEYKIKVILLLIARNNSIQQ